jgi:hypothetical protein
LPPLLQPDCCKDADAPHALNRLRVCHKRPRRRAGKRRQQFPSCNGCHMPFRREGAAATVARLGRGVSGMSPATGNSLPSS